MAIRYTTLLAGIFICNALFAQTAQRSGVINHYAAVTAIDTCTGRLTVSDTTGFRVGTTLLLLQMQGATIASGNNAQYGRVQNINSAGHYERAEIDSVAHQTIFVKNRLTIGFDPAGKVQVVTIPLFSDVIVTDTIKPLPWNGTTGGVVALEATGALTLNAPIQADGAGFRGGLGTAVANNNCNFLFAETSYIYAAGNWRGANKGEGIAVAEPGKELGRGPQSNGGGGGNDHNSGGGGGGNSSDGGAGGNNAEPSTLGCDGYFPGIGGYSVLFTLNRIFAGGGGGAGHANNLLNSAGANGGGIVFIYAGTINGTAPLVSANGASARTAIGDGGGGGGAGGTILLKADSVPANLILQAIGGRGGSTDNSNQNRCAGPGGGGAGGRILTNLAGVTIPLGGPAGIVINSTNGCNGSANDAKPGEMGFVQPLPAIPQGTIANALPQISTEPQPDTVCQGKNAQFTVGTNAGVWSYNWQMEINGVWMDLQSGINYTGTTTDTLIVKNVQSGSDGARYRCAVSRPGCFTVHTLDAALVVIPLPTAAFTLQTNGLTTTCFNQSTNALKYFWDFGDGSSSQEPQPQHTFQPENTYTILLYAISACDTAVATAVVSTFLVPTADFIVPDSLIGCLTTAVPFTNNASANTQTFQWSFAGGNPAMSTAANPVVTYTQSGTYTAQLIAGNNVGADTTVQTFVVQTLGFPVAAISYVVNTGGVVHFSNVLVDGTTCLWDFGDGSASVSGCETDHQYAQSGVYIITLTATNACGAAVIQENSTIVVNNTAVGETGTELGDVRLSPNPTDNLLRIDYTGMQAQLLEIQLFNIAGIRMLHRVEHFSPLTEVSLANFPAGVYLVRLRFAEGEVQRIILRL